MLRANETREPMPMSDEKKRIILFEAGINVCRWVFVFRTRIVKKREKSIEGPTSVKNTK